MMEKAKIAFWCEQHGDMELDAISGERRGKEFWFAYCPCCRRELIRYKSKEIYKEDPYFRQSKKMREEARRYYKLMLQPGMTLNGVSYESVYGNPYSEFVEKMKKKEEEEWEKKRKENPGCGKFTVIK